jgi:hypothetical protein
MLSIHKVPEGIRPSSDSVKVVDFQATVIPELDQRRGNDTSLNVEAHELDENHHRAVVRLVSQTTVMMVIDGVISPLQPPYIHTINQFYLRAVGTCCRHYPQPRHQQRPTATGFL